MILDHIPDQGPSHVYECSCKNKRTHTSATSTPTFLIRLLPHQQSLRTGTQRLVGLCSGESLQHGLVSSKQRQGCQIQVLGRHDQERVAWAGGRQQSWAGASGLLQACSRPPSTGCRWWAAER